MSETEARQRLAAILMADVAGYSRLMSCDERGTVAALDSARAVFRDDHRCAPAAASSTWPATRCSRCSTRRAAPSTAALRDPGTSWHAARPTSPHDCRMQFRIGIHLGDVMEKADGTIYGDGVNIAARLEGARRAGRHDGVRRRPCARARQASEATFDDHRRAARQEHRRSRCAPTASRRTRSQRRRRLQRSPAPAASASASTSRRSRSCRSTT